MLRWQPAFYIIACLALVASICFSAFQERLDPLRKTSDKQSHLSFTQPEIKIKNVDQPIQIHADAATLKLNDEKTLNLKQNVQVVFDGNTYNPSQVQYHFKRQILEASGIEQHQDTFTIRTIQITPSAKTLMLIGNQIHFPLPYNQKNASQTFQLRCDKLVCTGRVFRSLPQLFQKISQHLTKYNKNKNNQTALRKGSSNNIISARLTASELEVNYSTYFLRLILKHPEFNCSGIQLKAQKAFFKFNPPRLHFEKNIHIKRKQKLQPVRFAHIDLEGAYLKINQSEYISLL